MFEVTEEDQAPEALHQDGIFVRWHRKQSVRKQRLMCVYE